MLACLLTYASLRLFVGCFVLTAILRFKPREAFSAVAYFASLLVDKELSALSRVAKPLGFASATPLEVFAPSLLF